MITRMEGCLEGENGWNVVEQGQAGVMQGSWCAGTRGAGGVRMVVEFKQGRGPASAHDMPGPRGGL